MRKVVGYEVGKFAFEDNGLVAEIRKLEINFLFGDGGYFRGSVKFVIQELANDIVYT